MKRLTVLTLILFQVSLAFSQQDASLREYMKAFTTYPYSDPITVLIVPEIGGKIWAAIENKTGRSFIYYNGAVKFRDVAMRGPWTSGGLEANYGIIGHAPSCAAPVDYVAYK